ncbi:MAG: undecaprenyl-diphosphate phosphatase [Deinococcales bacterium]
MHRLMYPEIGFVMLRFVDYLFQAFTLGVVEGITEFLPISSTGHLIVTEHLLGFRDQSNTFTVVIQIGAILAVVLFYWRDLLARVTGLFTGQKNAWQFWLKLVVATIPAAVLGLLLEDILSAFDTPLTVAISLIVGGILLYWLETARSKTQGVPEPLEPQIDHISLRQAFLVGCFQVLALLFPGTSRSGASIVGGWLVGLNRVTATAFSFYLGIPTLGAAGLYKLYKARDQLSNLPGGATALLVGSVVSLITAFLAVSWLLRYVSRNNFKGFAIYRIVAGGVILLLLALNMMPNA